MKAILLLSLLLQVRGASTETHEWTGCPAHAAIDRIEGETAVLVLGFEGVRTIAMSQLHRRNGAIREGMIVYRSRENRCEVRESSLGLRRRVEARLRSMSR